MPDVSDVFLVRGSLQLLEPGEGDLSAAVPVAFTWSAGQVSTAFVPDADYILAGIVSNAGVIISTSSAITFNNIGTSQTGPRSDVYFIHLAPNASNLHIPLKKNQKVWLVSNSGGAAVLFLLPL